MDTVHVSGAANLARIFSDLQELTSRLGVPGLGGIGRGAGAQTALDVFTGAKDRVLRRLELTTSMEGALEGGQPIQIEIDVSIALGDVNQGQEIEPPEDARPIAALASQEVPAELSGLVDFLHGERPSASGEARNAGRAAELPPSPRLLAPERRGDGPN